MGFGGGGMAAQQAEVEQQLRAFQQQNAQTQKQAQEQTNLAAQNAATVTNVNAQYKAATQQTPAGQAASQLGIMDYIATSPQGLTNQPGTLGSAKLLGN